MPKTRRLKHEQETYQGRPTGWSVLEEIWDRGEDGPDDELAILAQVEPSTVVSYRRKYKYDRGEGNKDPGSYYPVCEEELPLRTIKGWVWCVPIDKGKMECDKCELRYLCEEAVRGEGYLGCERVLTSELLPGYVFEPEEALDEE